VKTLASPQVVDELIKRLDRITPDSARHWGNLSAAEMFCHLGDVSDAVLGRRQAGTSKAKQLPKPIAWLLINTALPFPKGIETRPGVDPRKDGSRPADFAADRKRAADGLRALSAAPDDTFPPQHFRFGTMTPQRWHRFLFKHTDHHLRQFGV
jgi:hypothetical protein